MKWHDFKLALRRSRRTRSSRLTSDRRADDRASGRSPARQIACGSVPLVATSWQHSLSRCVRCVRESAQIGRSGRRRIHLAAVYKVEGLVGSFPRGGSSPLERMGFGWKSGGSHRRRGGARVPAGGPWQRRGNSWFCSMPRMTLAAGGPRRGAARPDHALPVRSRWALQSATCKARSICTGSKQNASGTLAAPDEAGRHVQ